MILQFVLARFEDKLMKSDDGILMARQMEKAKYFSMLFIYWSNRFNKFLRVMPLKRFKIHENVNFVRGCEWEGKHKKIFALNTWWEIAFPNNIWRLEGEIISFENKGEAKNKFVSRWTLNFVLCHWQFNEAVKRGLEPSCSRHFESICFSPFWALSSLKSCRLSHFPQHIVPKEEINNLLLDSLLCWHISCGRQNQRPISFIIFFWSIPFTSQLSRLPTKPSEWKMETDGHVTW